MLSTYETLEWLDDAFGGALDWLGLKLETVRAHLIGGFGHLIIGWGLLYAAFGTLACGLQDCHASEAEHETENDAKCLGLQEFKHLFRRWMSFSVALYRKDAQTYTPGTLCRRHSRWTRHDFLV